jgi:argininosuccinate synthase
MYTKQTYKKVASYEVTSATVDKVLLLYSGGLDTSVMLTWLQEKYKAKVIALTVDIGQQHDDLEKVKQKAIALGAEKALVYDAKELFANEFLSKGIKANAAYQGNYHLSTPMARAALSKVSVEVAEQEGVAVIAHGCTGKGNDQVRFDGYILALNPNLKIIAPVREWNMDRKEEIEYAKKHNIPVPANLDFPYSVDDNMFGMTWEGGEIEEPNLKAPIEKFLTTYSLPQKAPKKANLVTLTFSKGLPTHINEHELSLSSLIQKANHIGGAHGVGIVQVVEDRLVGVKNRGVYEMPGAHMIITAHQALERYVSTRTLNEVKSQLDIKWGYLCYGALWYDPLMSALNAFNEEVNQQVTGTVTLSLFKGTVTVVAMESPNALAHSSFNNGEGMSFNVNASAGFIELYTLQMRLANQIKRRSE